MMKWALFTLSLVLEILYLALFALTIRGRGFRFWPPPSHRSWQFFTSWLLALIIAFIAIFLGLLDFDSFWLPSFWVRVAIAAVPLGLASVLGIWIEMVFPFRNTIGMESQLITRGPYHYTRNPQYICDSLSALVYMVLTNSWMVWVLGILGIVLNLLAPLTEEPWLEERYGEAYRKYKSEVPRFIGLRKM